MDERREQQLYVEHQRQRVRLLRDIAKLKEYKQKMQATIQEYKQEAGGMRRASVYAPHNVACEDLRDLTHHIQAHQRRRKSDSVSPSSSVTSTEAHLLPSWSKSKLPQLKPLNRRATSQLKQDWTIKGNHLTTLPEIQGVKAKYSQHSMSLNDLPNYIKAPQNSSNSNTRHRENLRTLNSKKRQSTIYNKDYMEVGEILWMNDYDRMKLQAYSKVTDWLYHNPIPITRRV